jgi:hypothetical protein
VATPLPLAERIIDRFKATFIEPPSWAWPYQPSIPLVGRNYKPGCSLLVYASAENLRFLSGNKPPWYFKEPHVWNRYRIQCDTGVRDSHDKFFPDVGIQPVTDGGLFAAARFASERLGLPTAVKPRTFLERIAVSNWCKFTIRRKARERSRNYDYIGDLAKLIDSLPFVVGELVELQPAWVLLPKQVWHKPVLQAAMRGASPRTEFLPVYQFNATVVNTHLRKYTTEAERCCKRFAGTPLGKWMANLGGYNERNAWRYIAHLDARIGSRLPVEVLAATLRARQDRKRML